MELNLHHTTDLQEKQINLLDYILSILLETWGALYSLTPLTAFLQKLDGSRPLLGKAGRILA